MHVLPELSYIHYAHIELCFIPLQTKIGVLLECIGKRKFDSDFVNSKKPSFIVDSFVINMWRITICLQYSAFQTYPLETLWIETPENEKQR